MRKSRGFTLIELMVVVTLTGILIGLALVSVRKAGTQNDVDRMAGQIRDAITMANRRAVVTGQPYMVDVRAHSVQWCQIDPTLISTGPWATTQTVCTGITAGEKGPILNAGNDAKIAFYASSTDTSTPRPPKTTLPGALAVYFGPLGTADVAFNKVMSRGLATTGFTVYLRREIADETDKRRRVIAYGMSARPKVIDNY